MSSCFFDQIHNIHFPLPGINQEGFKPWPHAFPCCQLSGFQHTAETTSQCCLKSRLKSLYRLRVQFEKSWAEHKFPVSNQLVLDRTLQWLKRYNSNQIKYGYTLQTLFPNENPTLLWPIACEGIWRYGMEAMVFTMGKESSDEFLTRLVELDTNKKIFVLVEQTEGLWVNENAFTMRELIKWCENSAVPLWMAIYQRSAEQQKNTYWQKKLGKLKQQKPLQWLGKDSHSRLQRICKGFETHC